MVDADMIRLPGGTFQMGSEAFYEDEGPIRQVRVGPFELQRTPVTNRQFAEFVEATGYLTVAERHLDPRDYPGIAPELLQPASAVFILPDGPVDLDRVTWWHLVPGACCRAPEGPGSDWRDRPDHPVVHVAHEDALAYARRRLRRLRHLVYAGQGGPDQLHQEGHRRDLRRTPPELTSRCPGPGPTGTGPGRGFGAPAGPAAP